MLLRALTVILLCSSVSWAGSFAEVLGAFAGPTLGDEPQQVDALEVDYGHTTFTLTGRIQPVAAADHTVGFVFSGSGRLSTRIEPGPFHQANLTLLEDTGERKRLGADGAWSATFEQATFFTNRMPEVVGEGAPASAEGLSDILSRTVERLEDTPYTGLDHQLAPISLNDIPGTAVLADLGDLDRTW